MSHILLGRWSNLTAPISYLVLLFATLVECAGAQGLGAVPPQSPYSNQPSPASFVSSLRNCPSSAAHPDEAWACAFLAIGSTTVLQPGLPATLPQHTALGGSSTAGTPSSGSNLDTQHGNTDSNSTTQALTQLDLSRLAPSSLVVPPNGTLTLTGFSITGAQLPAAPFPLPTTSFLTLLAIRLSPGARLQLSSVTITTTSCVSLALHQELACRSAPTPNFTVTPTSLVVHSFTTASLSAHDVVLTCSGRQLPAPCAGAVVRSGAEVLRAVTAWVTREDTPLAPLYLWVHGTVQLSRPPTDDIIRFGDYGPNATTPTLAGQIAPGESYLSDSVFRLSSSRLVLAGPPDRSSVLDLAGSSSLFGMPGGGAVRVQNLTLRGLPLGPALTYPASLVRLPLWTWAFMRRALGSSLGTLLHVSSVTVELPPEEMSFWRYAPGTQVDQPSVADAIGAGKTFGPPCLTEAVMLWVSQEFRPVSARAGFAAYGAVGTEGT